MIDYQLIRSARRKTLGLQVKQGRVFVRAPNFISLEQIEHFVALKSLWLHEKVKQQNSQPQVTLMTFTQNSFVWVLGEPKKLIISFQPIAQVLNLKDELRVVLPNRLASCIEEPDKLSGKVKQQLERWFKKESELYLKSKLPALSQHCQLFSRACSVRKYKARWGSCNSKGELSFNYLLMMTPSWVFDYVIIHEICHLKHLNHSEHFWALVAQYSPQYRDAMAWLKDHQYQLSW